MAKTHPVPEDQYLNPGDPAALGRTTDIDRRRCTRVVPMRVLALGVSRSGTSSLRQALADLGYKDCYHYAEVLQENSRDQDMWFDAFQTKFLNKGNPFQREEWDQLLGHCQAVTDAPCNVFYKELLEAYPDAKVVLTVRDNPDQWFASQMATVIPYVNHFCNPNAGLLTRMYRSFLPTNSRFYRFVNIQFAHTPMYRLLMQDCRDGTDLSKQWYLDYLDEIKRIVPPERLLVMNVKEGWKPLCEFLGEDEPLYPFPRKNDTATFQHHFVTFGDFIDQIARWNMLKTAGSVLAVGLALAFGARRYGLFRIQ